MILLSWSISPPFRECFVTTSDSQSTRTFLKAANQVLASDLRCILCDSSFGMFMHAYTDS